VPETGGVCRRREAGGTNKKRITADGGLYLVHHYLQRGFAPEKIINLSAREKEFYTASMLLYFDEEKRKWEALGNG
jgi:hypothetical protein